MIGTRVYPNAGGWLDPSSIASPGAYGRVTSPECQGRPASHWQVTAPNGNRCRLDPDIHSVFEHEDGTITVSPSIVFPFGGYHGFLQHGVWS